MPVNVKDLETLLRIANVHTFEYDTSNASFCLSDSLSQLIGCEPKTCTLDVFNKYVHVSAQSRFKMAIASLDAQTPTWTDTIAFLDSAGHACWLKTSLTWNDATRTVQGVCVDVTTEHIEHQRLSHREAQLQHIFDNVPVRIWYKDDENRILRLNKSAAKSMGLPQSVAEGADTYDLFPEMAKKYHEDDLKVINSGTSELGIVEKYTPLNQPHGWVRTDKIPYTDTAKQQRHVIVMAQDVSQEMEMKQKLQDSEERLRLILDSTHDGYWDWDVTAETVFYSPQFWKLFGLSPDTQTNGIFDLRGLVHEDDLEPFDQAIKTYIIQGGQNIFEYEARYYHADGKIIIAACRAKAVAWDKNGRPIRIVGTHTDMTELRTAHAFNSILNDRIKIAVENSKIGIWDWPVNNDNTGWYSSTCRELMGIDAQDWMKVKDFFKAHIHPDDLHIYKRAVAKHLKTRKPFRMELRYLHPQHGYKWFLIAGRAKWSSEGQAIRFAGTMIDFDTIKQNQIKIEKYAQQLETVNRNLDHFAYSASHDLKTPLRSISNLATWIEQDLKDVITETSTEYFELMHSRISRMENLLTDILAFSRTGKNVNDHENLNLNAILSEVIAWIDTPDGFNIIIENELPVVQGHQSSFEQLFFNLINNAIKHHDKPSGTVALSYDETYDHHVFCVRDDGPGIPEEYHAKVFEIFKTLKPKDKREGSGIGLSIVKKIIDAMSGTIDVENTEAGRGAKFTICIPKVMRAPVDLKSLKAKQSKAV